MKLPTLHSITTNVPGNKMLLIQKIAKKHAKLYYAYAKHELRAMKISELKQILKTGV